MTDLEHGIDVGLGISLMIPEESSTLWQPDNEMLEVGEMEYFTDQSEPACFPSQLVTQGPQPSEVPMYGLVDQDQMLLLPSQLVCLRRSLLAFDT